MNIYSLQANIFFSQLNISFTAETHITHLNKYSVVFVLIFFLYAENKILLILGNICEIKMHYQVPLKYLLTHYYFICVYIYIYIYNVCVYIRTKYLKINIFRNEYKQNSHYFIYCYFIYYYIFYILYILFIHIYMYECK